MTSDADTSTALALVLYDRVTTAEAERDALRAERDELTDALQVAKDHERGQAERLHRAKMQRDHAIALHDDVVGDIVEAKAEVERYLADVLAVAQHRDRLECERHDAIAERDEARKERDRLRDVVEHHDADDEGLTFRVAMTKSAGDMMACVATGPADREEDIVRAAVKIMEAWDILAFQRQLNVLIKDGNRPASERDALRAEVERLRGLVNDDDEDPTMDPACRDIVRFYRG